MFDNQVDSVVDEGDYLGSTDSSIRVEDSFSGSVDDSVGDGPANRLLRPVPLGDITEQIRPRAGYIGRSGAGRHPVLVVVFQDTPWVGAVGASHDYIGCAVITGEGDSGAVG